MMSPAWWVLGISEGNMVRMSIEVPALVLVDGKAGSFLTMETHIVLWKCWIALSTVATLFLHTLWFWAGAEREEPL
jgi:hypothetical protein